MQNKIVMSKTWVIRSAVRSQTLRAIKISSPGLPRARSLKLIHDLFTKNGYPPHLVSRLQHEAQRDNRLRPTRSGSAPVYLALPFIDDALSHRIEGIIRASHLNLKVAWKGGPNLKQKLVRAAYQPAPCPGGGRKCPCCEAGLRGRCHEKNVVYQMECQLCAQGESVYVGETCRSVRLRYNEHMRDAKNNKLDTPFGLHQTKHSVQLDCSNVSIKILHVSKDGPDRKIWESIFIRELQPTLNTQTSSWPIIWVVIISKLTDRGNLCARVCAVRLCCCTLLLPYACMYLPHISPTHKGEKLKLLSAQNIERVTSEAPIGVMLRAQKIEPFQEHVLQKQLATPREKWQHPRRITNDAKQIRLSYFSLLKLQWLGEHQFIGRNLTAYQDDLKTGQYLCRNKSYFLSIHVFY